MRRRTRGIKRSTGLAGATLALAALLGAGYALASTTITDPQGDATQNSAIPGSLDIKSATQTRVGSHPRRISHIVAMYGALPNPIGAGGNGDVEVCLDLFLHRPTAGNPNRKPYYEICAKGSDGARRRVDVFFHNGGVIAPSGRASEHIKAKTVRFTFRKGVVGNPGHYFWRWSTSDEIDGPVDDAPVSPGAVRLGLGG